MIKILGIVFLIISVLNASDGKKVVIEKILIGTEVRSKALIKKSLDRLDEYIDNMKNNTKKFTEELMSVKSIFLYIKSTLPFVEKHKYHAYITKLLSKYFFTVDELKTRLKNNFNLFIKELESIENMLAVNIRRVLANETDDQSIDLVTIEYELNKAVNKTISVSEWVSINEVTKLVVLEIGSIIGAIGISKIMISTGVISASALNSWWTLGGSIVIGFIADKLWTRINNPTKKIGGKVVLILDKVKFMCLYKIRVTMENIIKSKMIRYRKILGIYSGK